MDRFLDERILGVPWILVAAAALAVAIVFLVLDVGPAATGLRWIVLRWAHGGVWVVLALAAVAMARVGIPVEWAGPLAAAGGGLYLIYLGFLVIAG